METKKEKINWRRLLITTGIMALTALAMVGTTYYIMNQQIESLTLENSLGNVRSAATTFCTSKVKLSEDELVAYAKSQPGIRSVKIELEDGEKVFRIGYIPLGMGEDWADEGYSLDCEKVTKADSTTGSDSTEQQSLTDKETITLETIRKGSARFGEKNQYSTAVVNMVIDGKWATSSPLPVVETKERGWEIPGMGGVAYYWEKVNGKWTYVGEANEGGLDPKVKSRLDEIPTSIIPKAERN